jgi:hypothetical protein
VILPGDQLEPARKILEFTVPVVSAVSALTFVTSLAHELGYFSIVGEQYLRFMQVGDLLTTALIWVPYTIFFVVTGLTILGLVSYLWGFHAGYSESRHRVAAGLSPTGETEQGPPEWVSRALLILFAFWTTMSAFSLPIGWPALAIFVLGLLVTAAWFYSWLLRRSGMTAWVYSLLGTSTVLVLAFMLGENEAFEAIRNKENTVTVTTAQDTKTAVILRSYQAGLLLLISDARTIEFINIAEVKTVQSLVRRANKKSTLCLLGRVLCEEEATQ